MKEIFEATKTEFIVFENEDVITNSLPVILDGPLSKGFGTETDR